LKFRQTGSAMLSFCGPETHGYDIQSSDALPPVWQFLKTVTNLSATTTIPDNAATNSPCGFTALSCLIDRNSVSSEAKSSVRSAMIIAKDARTVLQAP